MRDVWIAGSGVVLGSLLGIGGTVVVELVVAGAVALTVVTLTARPEPAPPPVTEVVHATPAKRAPVAEPGELQLMTMAAVQPMVDGVPMPFDPSQGFLAELPEGTHRVEILDVLARPVATTDVVVMAGQRTQLRWSKKVLSDLGRVPMLGATVAAAAPPPAPVAPVAPVVVDVGTEVEAAIAAVEGEQKAIEAVAKGLLALPKLGRRLGRGR